MINTVKKKLLNNKTVFGTWNLITSPMVCEVLAQSGLDFQILDMEHGQFSFETLENSIRAIDKYECSPLVRIGGLNLNDSQKALDLGAHGLVFPQVKGVDDANMAMSFCQFPPNGIRGLNPFTRYKAYSVNSNSELFQAQDDFSLNSIILENKEALSELDLILKIKNLDLIYLGAYDMSVSLGLAGQVNSPEIKNFIEAGIKKIRSANKFVGVMASDMDSAKRYQDLGANLIIVGVDSYLMGTSVQKILNSYKKN